MALPDLEVVLADLGHGIPASAFESDHLEFKEPAETVKKTLAILAETAVCLSNAEGGLIVLGINDRATGRAEALVGAPASRYPLDDVRRGIFERTAPPLTLIAEERLVDGVRLVVLRVPAGLAIHATSAGLATRRMGSQCVPFTPDQQREVLVARGFYDWSAEATGERVESVSAAQMDRLRKLLRSAGQEELAHLRDGPLLEALRLAGQGGHLSRAAALLLLDDEPLRSVVPAYGYSYQYRPAPGREATTRFRGHLPILEALELLLGAIEARSEIRPLDVGGGQQLQLVDYPIRAVRELVVNAFLHRSYEQAGTVDVEHSPEQLVIWSPGGLVAGVTPENILVHASRPRNLLLADAISRLRIAERTGQGIDRAYREMLRAGKQPPGFHSDQDVRVVVQGGIGNAAFVEFVNELPPTLGTDVEVLLVLSTLRARPSLSAVHLASRLQSSPAEADQVLRGLADDRVAVLEP